ncbi:hypothetical protein K5Q02_22210 [Pseudomonas sp. MM211]|uniref:hypothetical protein n=1 Tax=Pseudomonas sp. MM211 TaxID=2866808 RepID=UPI001CEC1ED3|nr:hypothetical protein [Pseudomonas sp. MM211]UCJ16462.1 hypothetical protein K5Q02_22210 [Pseudomonas sp. MM211]
MLEITRLKIIAKTSAGDFGVDIPFKNGLFILRVENTHGKSTCMNAIAYALGMERALGLADAKVPFPPSLTKEIEDENGIELPVISSMVFLEISNSKGSIATIKRQVLGVTEDNVAFVYPTEMDRINETLSQKLFLHREGDTTRALGFYYWLSKFVGWELPIVPRLDGREANLYPAVFFPTWFVEQKKGWTSIQATTPFFLKIKEAKKRSIEFMLSLETNEIVNKKFKIKTALDDINYAWKFCKKSLSTAAAKIGGEISGVPDAPEVNFDPFKIDIGVKHKEKWRSIQFLKSETEAELDIFIKKLKETVSAATEDHAINDRIDTCKAELKELSYSSNRIEEDISYCNQQINSTDIRINTLKEDQRKYEDLTKIGQLEIIAGSELEINTCPTCTQNISENLANLSNTSPLMSLDESLEYIKEQGKVFKSVKSGLIQQKSLKEAECNKINIQITKLIEEINRLQKNILPFDSLVMEENLRKKIDFENLIKTYADGISAIMQARLELDSHLKNYKSLIEQRRKLPQNILSTTDSHKLNTLRSNVVSLLSSFGFSSFKPDLIRISEETYLPTRDGFDLGFDTSASDGIRIIWSYLIGLFQVGCEFNTNHPRILIFDEPRQQEAKKVSFTALLKAASIASNGKGQIILATSEDEDALVMALEGSPHTLYSFPPEDGKILRKL